jgi:Flp pilus assembly protein TadG
MRRRRAATDSHDRGSVAVEFALLLPVLLLIIFGTIDFGRAINAQITLTQAAREGARLASLGYTSSAVTTRTQSAATGLSNVTVTVTTCAAGAGAGVDGVVNVSYPFTFITPVGAFASMFGTATFGSSTLTITAKGEMPCETLSHAVPARCVAAWRWNCSAVTSAGWSASSSACCSAPSCWACRRW